MVSVLLAPLACVFSMPTSKTTAPTEEELDAQRFSELEAKVLDIVQLLADGTTRASVEKKIEQARLHVDSVDNEARPLLTAYHEHAGVRVPTTRRTQGKMRLLAAMKERERVYSHPRDLEHGLHSRVNELIEIAERQWRRRTEKRASRKGQAGA